MFTHDRKVAYSEISMEGYPDIAQIADYFQDCSVFQSDSLGLSLGYLNEHHSAWLLASWQIIIDEYPQYGQDLKVSTWPYKFDAVFGYRNFTLHDENGKRLAVANSQWILVDTETGHPNKIDPDFASQYPVDEKADMAYASRKVPFKEEAEAKEPIKVARALIDTNQHVNNAQYIRMALEYLPLDAKVHQVRVEYKTAATLGTVIYPYIYKSEQVMKVLLANENKKPYAVVEFTLENVV